MALAPGSSIGHYDVSTLIGEGGMGQVWQATDTQLNRQVALKILPDAFAADPDRLARFQREAQVLASLNHPNIAAIHGIEEAGGTRALVLELVEGPTLEDRIKQGAIPLDEALPIAKQIAEALEAAHEAGVIHRDLKPANIKVREDGTVKVLDFGLAKALDPSPTGDPDQSPTLTAAATQIGVIMGTASYMSPEQARGKPVDKRSDIWAFGAVVYEMLSGRRAFQAEDVSSTLADVIRGELAWDALPGGLPPSLVTFLRRCLERNPTARVRDIGDVRLALAGAFETEVSSTPAVVVSPPRAAWQRAVPWAAAALFAGLAMWAQTRPAIPTPVMRFSSPFEAGQAPPTSGNVALTSDGSALVYVGPGEPGQPQRIWVRRWADLEATPIRGTEGVMSLVVSPDDREVAFAGFPGRLRVVSLDGGPVRTVADQVVNVWDWGADGYLYVSQQAGDGVSLARIPVTAAAGQDLDTITELREGEVAHIFLSLLPGERKAVFQSIPSDSIEDAQVWVLDLDGGERHFLVGGHAPRYVSGHVIFGSREGALMAAPLDVTTGELAGSPVPVVEGVAVSAVGDVSYTVSESGTLGYFRGGDAGREGRAEPVWVSRSYDIEPVDPGFDVRVQPGFGMRLSPDGRRLALATSGDDRQTDAWIKHLPDGPIERITLEEKEIAQPSWTVDGEHVVYTMGETRIGPYSAWQSRADGTGTPQLLLADARSLHQPQWAPDGEWLVFRTGVDILNVDHDIVGFRPDSDGAAVDLIATPGVAEEDPALSPDGRWLAYTSNRSGRSEVYVQPFPDVDSGRWQISVDGGRAPRWAPGGSELYYVDAAYDMVAAEVDTTSEFRVVRRESLFTLGPEFQDRRYLTTYYDVSSEDG